MIRPIMKSSGYAWLLATLLSAWAPDAPAQALVSSLIPASGMSQAGADVLVDLLTVNPGASDAPFATPDTLTGRIYAGQREWPVQLQATSSGWSGIAAGGFASRSYSLTLPSGATGRLILEVALPGAPEAAGRSPLRTVLEVQNGTLSAPADADPQSALSSLTPPASELQRSFISRFGAHEPLYFIYGPDTPAAKFQFSFKYRLLNLGESDGDAQPPALKFGYTQRSLWELGSSSSPFYDTSYMPSLFVEWLAPRERSNTGVTLLGLQGGVQHESNGQPAPDSRSVNTVFARASLLLGPADGFHVVASPRVFGYVASLSDNRDVARYRGHGELQLQIGRTNGIQLAYTGRIGSGFHNPTTQLDLNIPLRIRRFDFASYFLIQYFNGYGENLRDYNQRIETVRAGFSLLR